MLPVHCPDKKWNIEGKEEKELGFRPHGLCSVTALHHTLCLLRIPHGHDMAHCTAENQGDWPDLKVAEVRFKSRGMRLQMQGCRAQMQSFGAQMQRSPALRQLLEIPPPSKVGAPSLDRTCAVQPLPVGDCPQGPSYISVSLGPSSVCLPQAGRRCPSSSDPLFFCVAQNETQHLAHSNVSVMILEF